MAKSLVDSNWPPLSSTSPSISPHTASASVSTALVTPSPPSSLTLSTALVTPSPSSSLTPMAPPFAPLPAWSVLMPSMSSPMSSQSLPLPPPTHPLLYSPSSPTDSPQAGTDHTLHELRSSMTYCMDRFRTHEEHIAGLTKQYESMVVSLKSVIAQQNHMIQSLHAIDKQKDSVISKLSEDLVRLASQFQNHYHAPPPPVPDPQVQEQIATIQTEVQRHSEWVEVARKAPSRSTAVSETIAESERRAQRSLNLRIRGIEKVASSTPLQQAVKFVTQTMDIADHGIVSAYRAGGDPTRPQPLIMRFRDTETRLAVLRRRRRLSDFPQIHLDEDLTPLQWQVHRALLPQRHAARQEGHWAVIRDGRLITRPLRTTRGGTDDRETTEILKEA